MTFNLKINIHLIAVLIIISLFTLCIVVVSQFITLIIHWSNGGWINPTYWILLFSLWSFLSFFLLFVFIHAMSFILSLYYYITFIQEQILLDRPCYNFFPLWNRNYVKFSPFFTWGSTTLRQTMDRQCLESWLRFITSLL